MNVENIKIDKFHIQDYQVEIGNIVDAFEMNNVDEMYDRILERINNW